MLHGAGQVVRQSMVHAKPWQRYALCVLLVAAGSVIAVFGEVKGVALAGTGCLLAWGMISARRRARREPAVDEELTASR